MEGTQPTGKRPPWLTTLIVVWTAELVAVMGMALVIPFLPLYLVTDLGVPEAEARWWGGLVAGVNFFCAALAAPFWGSLADRYGRKPMLLRALLGLALAVGLMGYAQNVYQLLALRIVQGLLGGFIAAAIALVGSSVPRERLGSALGFLQTSLIGGQLLGPLLGGMLSDRFGFRSTFHFTGVLLLLAAVLVVFLVKERHSADGSAKVSYTESLRLLLAEPRLRLVAGTMFFSACGVMLLNPQFSLLVREMIPDEPNIGSVVGLITAAPALTSFFAAPLWGRAGDRRGHERMLLLALLFGALVHPWGLLLALPWQLFVLRALLGISSAAVSPAAHSLTAQFVAERRTASAFSLLSSAQMLGAALGPIAGGKLARYAGIRPLFGVTAVLLAFAAFGAWLLNARPTGGAAPREKEPPPAEG